MLEDSVGSSESFLTLIASGRFLVTIHVCVALEHEVRAGVLVALFEYISETHSVL